MANFRQQHCPNFAGRFRILFVIILPLIVKAQSPDTLWTRAYGGVYDEKGMDIRPTSDGGFIVVGGTNTFGAGNYDVYLLKLNRCCDTIWTKAFGGSNLDYGKSVRQTPDGGYIVAGYTESFGIGNKDVYLIKTDANGNQLWYRTFGGTDHDAGHCVQLTMDGGYIIAGYKRMYRNYVYLIKTDNAGNPEWDRTYGHEDDDQGHYVVQNEDGGFTAIGSTFLYGTGYHSSFVYLFRTDQAGNQLWYRTFGEPYTSDIGYCIQKTNDDGYIITGRVGGYDVYLFKTDDQGNELWDGVFGGTESEYGYSVRQLSDNGYLIAGFTGSFGSGGLDAWILKTDSTGILEWDKTVGNIYDDVAYGMTVTNGYVYCIGSNDSNGSGNSDVWLIKLGDTTIQIDNIQVNQLVLPSKHVGFSYDLQHLEQLVTLITLQISDDDGLSWDVPATHVWGDIGPNILPGTGKTIYWNAGLDYPNQFNQNMRIKIIADDEQ